MAELGPGEYELISVVHDLGKGRIGAKRIRFQIPKAHGRGLWLSGPTLAKLSRGDMVVGAYSPFPRKKSFPRRFRRETIVPLLGGELSAEDVLVTYSLFLLGESAGGRTLPGPATGRSRSGLNPGAGINLTGGPRSRA